MIKIIIFTLRLYNISHVTLGRFDQYMYPFYKADIEKGISKEEILELTEEFFHAFVRSTECTLHIKQLAGSNSHHIIEGAFKSFARSLRAAVAAERGFEEEIPSTKGVL